MFMNYCVTETLYKVRNVTGVVELSCSCNHSNASDIDNSANANELIAWPVKNCLSVCVLCVSVC